MSEESLEATEQELIANPTDMGDSEHGDVVTIRDLNVQFATSAQPVSAVKSVNLDVHPKEILAIVGESGSGKTVTSKSIMGLLPESAMVSGSVILHDKEVTTMSGSELRNIRGTDVAMIFQEPSTALNPVFKVGWQIAEGLRAHRKISKAEARQVAIDVLDKVGIPDPEERVNYYPHQFSGGQKQRIVIAQALALGAKVLLADEPTTALDVTVQAEILELLRQVRDNFDVSIILVTHNMGVVADLSDRVAVMYQGRIVEQAPTKELFANPRAAYTKSLLAAVPRLSFDEYAKLDQAEREKRVKEAEDFDKKEREWMESFATTHEPIVVADKLEITYPGRFGQPGFRAVRGVSLKMHPREVLGLVGESGSGKTTIGRSLVGLTEATGGSLKVFGTEVVHAKQKDFKDIRPRVGFVFQDPATSFNPLLSIAECIAEPLIVHGDATNLSEALPRVHELLDWVHLERSYAKRFPHELSGGQRQRASLARALALNPELIIADEPTSALDVSVQAHVLQVFKELQNELHFACLFITHDLAVVGLLADRIGVLRQGELVEIGTVPQVLGNPRHEYTKRLLASVPVADPVEQEIRRKALLEVLAKEGTTV
ncbi:MAG: ABC transporter ATP-binding protein [Actinomycetaceae bacterium]|nr:ABC transporter ATP-binding protein [Actinomycetaceae bacterium]